MQFSFLICSERSGSNLITRMLDAHSAICGPATKHLVNPVARNAYRYEPLNSAGHWRDLLEDVAALLAAEFSVWKRAFSVDDLARLAAPGDVAGLVRGVFEAEAAAHGKSRLFIKENHVYEFVAFLLLNFPAAHYVYLVRDPRDMALSWKRNPGHPGGVCRAARQWQADQQASLRLFSELHRAGRAERVHYEALIADPAAALAAPLAMMGLQWEPGMLAFHEAELTQANAGQQKAWANLGRAVMADNRHKYRQALSRDELCAVEAICRDEMQLLGYAGDVPTAELDAFMAARLAAFEESDFRAKAHVPPPSVQANVAAKKRFYQRRPAAA